MSTQNEHPGGYWKCKCSECSVKRKAKKKEAYVRRRSNPAEVEKDRKAMREQWHRKKSDPEYRAKRYEQIRAFSRTLKGQQIKKRAAVRYYQKLKAERPDEYAAILAKHSTWVAMNREYAIRRRREQGYDKRYLEKHPDRRKETMTRYAKKWWATLTPEQHESIKKYNNEWFFRKYHSDEAFRQKHLASSSASTRRMIKLESKRVAAYRSVLKSQGFPSEYIDARIAFRTLKKELRKKTA